MTVASNGFTYNINQCVTVTGFSLFIMEDITLLGH
jgi:hypothetical protein